MMTSTRYFYPEIGREALSPAGNYHREFNCLFVLSAFFFVSGVSPCWLLYCIAHIVLTFLSCETVKIVACSNVDYGESCIFEDMPSIRLT